MQLSVIGNSKKEVETELELGPYALYIGVEFQSHKLLILATNTLLESHTAMLTRLTSVHKHLPAVAYLEFRVTQVLGWLSGPTTSSGVWGTPPGNLEDFRCSEVCSGAF